MTWFTANVTLTNGQQKVDWNSGDPLSKLSAGDGLIVNGGTPLEIISIGSVDFMLKTAWPNSTVTTSVTAVPLPADFIDATEKLRSVSVFGSSLFGQMAAFAAAETDYVTVTDAAGVDYSVPTPKIIENAASDVISLKSEQDKRDVIFQAGNVVKLNDFDADTETDVSGLLSTIYTDGDFNQIDLNGQTWDCTGYDVDNATDRNKLNYFKFYNGSLICTNAVSNDTQVQTFSGYSEDEIRTVSTKSPVLDWEGLNVLWLGTSIPHQGVGNDGYPELFSKRLNCTVTNNAWSGSHAFYNKNGSSSDLNTVKGLSMTDADVTAGLAAYGGSSVYDDSFDLVTKASEMTVEHRILSAFQTAHQDVVMLDHNHNDRKAQLTYTSNVKTISSITKGATTTVVLNNVTGLAVGDGFYLRVTGIANLDYAAGRIQSISSNTLVVSINSTGFTGSLSSGSFYWVDRNTLQGAFDFLIAYIKNCSVIYGDGSTKVILCNSPSYFTNNTDRDYPIWSAGKAIKSIAASWGLAFYDVANDFKLTYQDQLIYLSDGVHPSTFKERVALCNHWVKWASGGATKALRPAEFLSTNESLSPVHQEPVLYSKYDDKYAIRDIIFSQDAYLIDEDFSGGIGSWTTTGTAPVVETAPWGVDDAVKFSVTSGAPTSYISKLAALGHDSFLSFDMYFNDVDIASGTSNQLTVASLLTAGSTAYNVTLIQTVGSELRMRVSRTDGAIGYANISETIIDVNTKYTVVFDVIKGATTSTDGYVYVSVNGDKKYAGEFDNGGVATITAVRVGAVFNNMLTTFNFHIGNVQAAKKSRLTNASWGNLYHSGNTNFNVFTITSGKILTAGAKGITTVFIDVELPLNSVVSPTSITCSGGFNITHAATGDSIATSVLPVMVATSSPKILAARFTVTGAVVGDDYKILSAPGVTSIITVNF